MYYLQCGGSLKALLHIQITLHYLRAYVCQCSVVAALCAAAAAAAVCVCHCMLNAKFCYTTTAAHEV